MEPHSAAPTQINATKMAAATSSLTTVTRAAVSHVPQWQRFQTERMVVSQATAAAAASAAAANAVNDNHGHASPQIIHPYQRQLSHVHQARLMQLGPRVWNTIQEQQKDIGPDVVQVQRVLELQEDAINIVVGTLVQEPSCSPKNDETALSFGSLACASDAWYLEDVSGRVTLQVDAASCRWTWHEYATGVVLGVQGRLHQGVLTVDRVFLPSTLPPTLPVQKDKDVRYVLLLSGLECGSTVHASLPRDVLLTYLQGHVPTLREQAARVARVVIAGGLIAAAPASLLDHNYGLNSVVVDALRDLDAFLWSLCATGLPVDVVPGAHDPTTANWPQRPLYGALLPRSRNMKLLSCTPNPYQAQHDGSIILATDGTNVRDLCRRVIKSSTTSGSEHNDDDDDATQQTQLDCITPVEALEKILAWSHLCPTGPQYVPCRPHPTDDPMVMKVAPHVLVAGNCDAFDVKIVNGTTLICVPSFARSGQAVLLNTATGQVEQLLQFQ